LIIKYLIKYLIFIIKLDVIYCLNLSHSYKKDYSSCCLIESIDLCAKHKVAKWILL